MQYFRTLHQISRIIHISFMQRKKLNFLTNPTRVYNYLKGYEDFNHSGTKSLLDIAPEPPISSTATTFMVATLTYMPSPPSATKSRPCSPFMTRGSSLVTVPTPLTASAGRQGVGTVQISQSIRLSEGMRRLTTGSAKRRSTGRAGCMSSPPASGSWTESKSRC